MRNIRLLNGLLWAFNGLLGTGVVVFAFLFLIFPQESAYLRGFDRAESGPRTPDRPVVLVSDQILKTLRNPVEKSEPKGTSTSSPTNFRATLTGVIPSDTPKGGAAFLRLTTRNMEFPAFPDEPIIYDGKPVEELAGWRLSEVTKGNAVFTNGNQRQVLTLETEPTKAGPGGGRFPASPPTPGARVQRAGQPYQAEGFRSQVLSSSDNQQVWALDPQEIDWAFQNQDRIIDQDFQVAPIPGGGLKIENVQAGTMGATRGLMAGDVVKNVNGIPLNSLTDIRNLLQNPAMQRQSVLRLTLERAGRTMVIMYQPLRQ